MIRKLNYHFPKEMNAILVYGIRISGALLTFLLQIFLARYLGQYEYGLFAFVWACLIILGELLSFGFYNLIQRLIPQYRVNRQFSLLRGAIWGAAAMIFFASSALVAVILLILSALLSYDVITTSYAYPLMIAALSLPAFVMADYLSGIGRSYGWMIKAFAPTALIRPVSIIALLIGAAAYGVTMSAQAAMIAATLSIWLTLIFSLLWIGRTLPTQEIKGPKDYKLKHWFLTALPMMMISSFELMLFNIDVLMISYYLPADQTGIYFAATKIMALVAFINFAVGSAYTASFATHYADNDKTNLAKAVSWSASLTFYTSLVMIVCIFFLKDHLLALFGSDFIQASYIILPLAIGLICRAFVGPGERILMMTGKQNICALVYIGVVLADIILNILLIPHYGLNGAAIATCISFVLMAITLHIVISKHLGVASHPRPPQLFLQNLTAKI